MFRLNRLSLLSNKLTRGAIGVALVSTGLIVASRVALGPVLIPSDSMQPTVAAGTVVLINRLAYGVGTVWNDSAIWLWSQPARGDIIVFRAPRTSGYSAGTYLFKRVVGIAGDRISVAQQQLILNGAPLHYDRTPGSGLATEYGLGAPHRVRLGGSNLANLGETTVPPGCVWVMGDNRGASHDSRAWGCVPVTSIEGRATSLTWIPPR